MKKALIVYQSKKGHTRAYAEEMGSFMQEKGITADVMAVKDLKNEHFSNVSHLLMGCWTSGLFLLFQHPDKEWIKFVRNVSIPAGTKIGLFTTYKIATGVMFKSMKKHLGLLMNKELPEFKSKTGKLSSEDKNNILRFLEE
jgi:flavodoxin